VPLTKPLAQPNAAAGSHHTPPLMRICLGNHLPRPPKLSGGPN